MEVELFITALCAVLLLSVYAIADAIRSVIYDSNKYKQFPPPIFEVHYDIEELKYQAEIIEPEIINNPEHFEYIKRQASRELLDIAASFVESEITELTHRPGKLIKLRLKLAKRK